MSGCDIVHMVPIVTTVMMMWKTMVVSATIIIMTFAEVVHDILLRTLVTRPLFSGL